MHLKVCFCLSFEDHLVYMIYFVSMKSLHMHLPYCSHCMCQALAQFPCLLGLLWDDYAHEGKTGNEIVNQAHILCPLPTHVPTQFYTCSRLNHQLTAIITKYYL